MKKTLVIFSLFLLYNYKLVMNLSTALIDWLDYPLIVYTIQQHIQHLWTGNLAGWATLDSFHPSPGGLFFTDIMLPQGILGSGLYFFTKNYLLIFNLIFLLTILLNIIGLQFFWKKIFRQEWLVGALTLLFVFSPYYFSQYVHYQMVAYFFFFFSAGVLLEAKNTKSILVAGTLTGLQFLTGVYLGIFSLTFSVLWLAWRLASEKSWKKLFSWMGIYALGFFLVAGIFVGKYWQVKTQYQLVRNASGYVEQALQPTDWLFNHYPSWWVKNIYSLVNAFDNHTQGELFSVGWSLLLLAVFGLLMTLKKMRKADRRFVLPILIILGWSLLAGLGPRLTLLGKYYGFSLPYLIIMKLVPLFDAVRVTGRWFFLTQIGLLFFVGHALLYLEKKLQKKWLSLAVALWLLIYAIEMLPLDQRTAVKSYRTEADQVLVHSCRAGEVLLQYPFSPQWPYPKIEVSLNYWVEMLLNKMDNHCQMVNGYSGFDPPHFVEFRQQFEEAMKINDRAQILKLLGQKQVKYLKINKLMLDKYLIQVDNLKAEPWLKVLFENQDFLVAQVE